MPKSEFTGQFEKFFSAYVRAPDEELLANISEIGKELVRNSIPPEDIGELYEKSLSIFSEKYPDTRLSDIIDRISVPLVELLMAYGLAFREQLDRRRIYEETRLASKIMENSIDGIWMTDDKGNIQLVNPSFSRITGYKISEIVGENMALIHGFAIDDVVMEKIWEMVRKDGIWKGELANRRKNGQIYPALLSISTIRDGNNRILNYVGVLNDISEKHREEDIRQEVERAREIYNLVIQPQLPEMAGIEINAKCVPAESIGGDTMEIVKVDSKKLIIFIADITGHGISAAMTANTLKVLFREISETTAEPSKIFHYINSVMYNNILPDDMIAAFCGRIDLERMNITYCLNGLPNPFIYRNGTFIRLKPTGYPLGVFEDQESKALTVPIQHGDLFVIFTDGISEARAENGEVFGNIGIENSIGNKKHDVHTIIDDLIKQAILFQNRETFSDDVIVVAVNIYDEKIVTSEVSRTNTYSFPTKSVCRGKTKFLFIDETVSFFLNDLAKKSGLPVEDLGSIRIALFELVLNAIEHGNLEMTEYKNNSGFYDSEEYWKIFHDRMASDEYGNRQINIECQINSNQIEITIEDGGHGFNVNAFEHPDKINLFRPSGRGIALAKMNVDKLTYNAKGNKVTILKKVH